AACRPGPVTAPAHHRRMTDRRPSLETAARQGPPQPPPAPRLAKTMTRTPRPKLAARLTVGGTRSKVHTWQTFAAILLSRQRANQITRSGRALCFKGSHLVVSCAKTVSMA